MGMEERVLFWDRDYFILIHETAIAEVLIDTISNHFGNG